jgi:hypothetical protein
MDPYHPPTIDQNHRSLSIHEQALELARNFRLAAREYLEIKPLRTPSDSFQTIAAISSEGKVVPLAVRNFEIPNIPFQLNEKCGQWLILAWRLGLVPRTPPELCQTIEWYQSEQPPMNGRHVVESRCPNNLFRHVCGGNFITGEFDPPNEDGHMRMKNVRPCGGLLPALRPGHLDLPTNQRYAATCDWIADKLGQVGELNPVFLTAYDIADWLNLDRENTRIKLARYAKKSPECVVEIDWQEKDDPRSIYRVSKVIHLFQKSRKCP